VTSDHASPSQPTGRPYHPAPPAYPAIPAPLEPPAQALDEALRAWLDAEVGTLTKLAHTLRLKGDFVAAQFMEQEVRQLLRQVAGVYTGVGK
jgi:hypothetical protein